MLLRFLRNSVHSNEAANCIHQCKIIKDDWYNMKNSEGQTEDTE